MSQLDVDFVAELCAARAGLRVEADKPYLIESRLAPVARREGFASVADLVGAVQQADGEERLAWELVEAMAQRDGGFFRDREPLLRLWRETLPQILRRRPEGVVRIWSAAAGAGQEIYSLAMLAEAEPPQAGEIELFASDLGERQLQRARAGLYGHFEVQRGLAAAQLVRFFENRDDQFLIARRLRERIRWRRVNLMEDVAPPGSFDVVLCRGLLSGMTEEAQARVLGNLQGALAPDGVLLLGGGDPAPRASGLAPLPGVAGAYVKVALGVRAAA